MLNDSEYVRGYKDGYDKALEQCTSLIQSAHLSRPIFVEVQSIGIDVGLGPKDEQIEVVESDAELEGERPIKKYRGRGY